MSAAAVGMASIFAVSLSQSVSAATVSHTHDAAVLDLSGARTALGKQTTAATGTGGGSATPAGADRQAAAKAAAPAASTSAAAPAAAASAPAAPAAQPAPPAPTEKELTYQFQLQTTFFYCGPAATRIAASARGLQPSQDELAGKLGTTVNGTNSAEDVTRVLNGMTGTSFYHTTSIPGQAATPPQMDQLQADIVHAVSNGYAVVMNIVGTAWDADSVPHAYDGGHYLTVVGYRDEGRLAKIADPANLAGDGSYWMTTINLANWSATRGYAS
jgi:hypothetical protein